MFKPFAYVASVEYLSELSELTEDKKLDLNAVLYIVGGGWLVWNFWRVAYKAGAENEHRERQRAIIFALMMKGKTPSDPEAMSLTLHDLIDGQKWLAKGDPEMRRRLIDKADEMIDAVNK